MGSTSVARKNRRLLQQPLKQLRALPPVAKNRQNIFSLNENVQKEETAENYHRKNTNPAYGKNIDHLKNKHLNYGNLQTFNPSPENTEHMETCFGYNLINSDASSHPIEKVFIEDERCFKAIPLNHLLQCTEKEDTKIKLAIDLAYIAAKYYHIFANLCHGFLGGLSFLYILIIYHLTSSNFNDSDLLEHFSFLSQPVHNIFNFLCVMCCISAFERYDIGDLNCFLKYIKMCRLRILIICLYPASLILGLSTTNIDDKIILNKWNASSEILTLQEMKNDIFYWKTTSLIKSVGVILGWILVALEPNFNEFLKKIKDITTGNICTT